MLIIITINAHNLNMIRVSNNFASSNNKHSVLELLNRCRNGSRRCYVAIESPCSKAQIFISNHHQVTKSASPSLFLCNNIRIHNDKKNEARKQGNVSSLRLFSSSKSEKKKHQLKIPSDGLTLTNFIQSSSGSKHNLDDANNKCNNDNAGPIPTPAPLPEDGDDEETISLKSLQSQILNQDDDPDDTLMAKEEDLNNVIKFHLKTYGCQMNVSDSDIVRSILVNHYQQHQEQHKNLTTNAIQFIETNEEMEADVLLTNTCAIRENAESKVWHRLRELRANDAKFPIKDTTTSPPTKPARKRKKQKRKRIIGVLGCMAERLKEDMFKDGTADLIVGPDAYRDLPRLIQALSPSPASTSSSSSITSTSTPIMERALNVELSFDETYADIAPVRKVNNNNNSHDVSAFVSVMRGCNNMCSYCVVPFTRGRERSRDLQSIVAESTKLFHEDGIKEIILLGQNVNSYHDKSPFSIKAKPAATMQQQQQQPQNESSSSSMYKSGYNTSNDGFTNMFNLRGGAGYYFVDLVEAVSNISPELRVRFTSPHPKDYPPELLSLMAERHNVCNQLHMPAQSGSTSVLKRMRRGYTREAYMELIDDVKATIPDVSISSDFIAGFCGETHEEHLDTLSLMEHVNYDQAYMFAYSMRGKTHAHRTMEDDVAEEIKAQRLQEIIALFRRSVQERNDEMEVGQLRLVLVEGESRKSKEGNRTWGGRTDQNKRINFSIGKKYDLPHCWAEDAVSPILSMLSGGGNGGNNSMLRSNLMYEFVKNPKVPLEAGDYAVVQVTEARGHTLRGRLLWRATMKGFNEMNIGQGGMQDGLSLFSL
jgi:tRNA A37 methylthiotransferase MiaB